MFLMLTMLVMVGYLQFRLWLNPPPPPEAAQNQQPADKGNGQAEKPPDKDPGQPVDEPDVPDNGEPEPEDQPKKQQVAPQWLSVGSVDPDSPYRMLLTFTNRGAALERAELSSAQFRDLEDDDGYLGQMALSNGSGGAMINVVGHGTPAASAICTSGDRGPGLQAGDVIVQFNDTPLESTDTKSFVEHYMELFHETHPGETITLKIRPAGETEDSKKKLTYTATLSHVPMQVIQPEHFLFTDSATPLQPLSFLTSLNVSKHDDAGTLLQVASLKNVNWEVVPTESVDEVKFRHVLTADELKDVGRSGPLEVIKTYTLVKLDKSEPQNDRPPGYSLTYTVEVKNGGEDDVKIRLEQDGPTGLPLEGWWYIRKGSPHWGSAGVRDVVWSTMETSGVSLVRNAVIVESQQKRQQPEPLFEKDERLRSPVMRFVGVDSPYFSAVMMPKNAGAPDFDASKFSYESADAFVIGEIVKQHRQTTGVTFRLDSEAPIKAGGSFRQEYTVFIGPKEPQILAHYGLQDTIIFGWSVFGYVARALLIGLHGIYFVVRNYGIAIILLTICVRLAVLPIGRKQAQNAAMMQMLAPEMKEIAAKHKDDVEGRTKATQELWKKYNYNPFGGCWMMFLQLPIFFGLYKALSTSIDLRQASLIPGIQWCSNLAGPDMFWYWKPYAPDFLQFLVGYNGYLGPYLNILPLVTIGLFIVHQKLFTPPPTDEQQALQQKMMSFMMIFMGFLFFKVPSGLCLYFITSSLWGIAERKIFPKPKLKGADDGNGGKEKSGKPVKPIKSTDKKKTVSKENAITEYVSKWLPKPPQANGDSGTKKRPRKKKKRK